MMLQRRPVFAAIALFWALCVSQAFAVASGDSQELKIMQEVEAIKRSAPISGVIPLVQEAGDVTRLDWKKAAKFHVNRTLRAYPTDAQATVFMLHDNRNLYVRLMDRDFPKLEGSDPFGADHWEIFISAQRGKPYRQLGVSASGSKTGVVVGEKGGEWNGVTSISNARSEGGGLFKFSLFGVDGGSNKKHSAWTVDLTFPLDRLLDGGAVAGQTFYMNFIRAYSGNADPVVLSPIFQGLFHCPERFGSFWLEQKGMQPPKPDTTLTPYPVVSMDCDAVSAPIKLLFPGGRGKALTMSYDDAQTHDRRLVSIFNKYGIRSTFNVPAEFLDKGGSVRADEIKDLYAGHEVACHTGNPNSATNEWVHQLVECREKLTSLVGYPVRGLAYVGGDFNERAIAALPMAGIAYGRTIAGDSWFSAPVGNPYLLQTTCHHADAMKYAKRFLEFKGTPAVFSVWGHSYEFEEGKNWEAIEEFSKLIGGRKEIWYTTNIELLDYIEAARRLKLSSNNKELINPSAVSLWIDVNGKPIELKPGASIPVKDQNTNTSGRL